MAIPNSNPFGGMASAVVPNQPPNFGGMNSSVVPPPNAPPQNIGGMTSPVMPSPIYNSPFPPSSLNPEPRVNNIGGLIGSNTTPGGLQGNFTPINSQMNSPTSPEIVPEIAPQVNPQVNLGQGFNQGANNMSQDLAQLPDFQNQVDSAYDAQTRRLDPMFEQRENDFRQRMVNQGIAPGSQAYDNAFANQSRDRNDAYNSAGYGSQQFGLQAQGQLAGQQLQQQGFRNQTGIANIGANASMYGANRGANASMYGADRGANASMYGADSRNQLGNAQLQQSGQQFNQGLNQQNYQFDVNDIFRNQQLDSQNALSFGQLGLAQDQFGLQSWQAQNQADNDYFNQIGALFGNAPGFTGFAGSSGLGNNAVNAGTAQSQQNMAALNAIGNIAGAIPFSSSKYKDLGEWVDTNKLLDAVNNMPIFDWVYNDNAPTDDRDEHIGTTSEQFYKALDMPEKDRIDTVDAVGVLTGAVQELTKRIEELEGTE